MIAGGASTRAALLLVVAGPACNGQFDFDTAPIDSGVPPIIVIEGGPDDASLTSDTPIDAPRTGVHISCGASDCLTSGCCSTSSGVSCVDIGDAETCGGLLIQCDDSDDCPAGLVCCAEGDDLNHPPCTSDVCDGDQRLLRVHCEPEARCRGEFVMLCNPDRPGPCTQCIASSLVGLPPGYHQCATTP
ncbi:MAG TPA: hypothetical protein VK550_03255 [Polyangiaceae bacterium]|nr:hypothetical protein [Polyangiaceae bacterium]